MLVEISLKISITGFMRYLKGKSSLMIWEIRCRGYYEDTAWKNAKKEYIQHQIEEDQAGEQQTMEKF